MSMALEVKCGSCSKKLPPNLRVINCSTCKSFFHVKCSDINKKEFLTIIDGGNDWNCFKCRPHLTKPNKTRCFDCKKTIPKNRVPIRCSNCANSYHSSCSGITIDKFNELNSWLCRTCLCAGLPFYNIDDEKFKLTTLAKDILDGEHLRSHPTFSIQSLLDKFPGTFSVEDFSFDTGTSKYFTPSQFISAKFEKNSFSALHINIVSLSAHIDDLKTLLGCLEHPFDIIGISETKIKHNAEFLSNINIPGYTFEYTPTKSHFGGTGIYIKNGINYSKNEKLSKSKKNVAESIFIEIEGNKSKKLLIGCVYRHHATTISDFVEHFLSNLLLTIGKKRQKTMLMGDFNVDLLKFDTHNETRDYYDLLSSNGFRPLIFQPTRVTSRTSTLIDNIFINDIETYSMGGNITTSISDHYPQFCIVDIFDKSKTNKREVKFGRSFENFNPNEFSNELKLINWNQILHGKSSPEALKIFYGVIEKLLDEMAPRKRLTKKELDSYKRPWVTFGLLKSMEERDLAFKLFAKETDTSKKDILWESFRVKRNLIKILVRDSKRQYYMNFFEENKTNLKRTWEGIRNVVNISKKKKTAINSLSYKDKYITDKVEIANSLNEFFVNIGNTVEEKIPQTNKNYKEYLGNRVVNSFLPSPVMENEIEDIISKMNKSKAAGPNSIPTNILKMNVKILAKPLALLINSSFVEGVFPDDIEIADVCPIFKKGDKDKCGNYRPISLLSNLSKLYERCMHTRLYDFLAKSDTFYEFQFGFRKQYSTNHALLSIVEEIKESLDKGNFACGVFIDLEKAFDTVNHRILLGKLEHYGLRGISNDWFRSYLSSRKQCIKLDGIKSDYRDITCGVPQGSILGPLLFLIYINDMYKSVKFSKIHHFADDTNLLCIENNEKILRKRMNEDLKLIFEWLCTNRLSLNVAKTEFIIFKPPKKRMINRFTLKLDGKTIFESPKIKYLGLIMDSRLTWKYHINELRKKLSKSIGIIYKMKNLAPLRVLNSLYYALFHSHLNYGICVWGNASEKLLQPIFMLQKKVIRMISNADYQDNTGPLFVKLSILKLEDIFKQQVGSLMWDCENNKLPSCLSFFFKKVKGVHNYSTRCATSNKLCTDNRYNTTTHGSTMFKNYGSKLWNSICDLKFYEANISKSTFRKKYKNYLIDFYK